MLRPELDLGFASLASLGIRKPPLRLSAAQLIARLRSELQMLDSSHCSARRPPSSDFTRALLEKQIGLKIPVTMRAILDSAWT